jgi:hypothetical protein
VGYSLAWVGVRGISYQDAIARLALKQTGENTEYAESPVSARSLPDGWTLVVARGCDHRIIKAGELAELSVGGVAIACSVEEHVMFSSCELWANGAKQWRVEHDAQKSIDDLAASGTLPEDFTSVRAEFAAQQDAEGGKEAEVDLYFEIPLTLAQSRVGFKHDEVNGAAEDEQFEVLLEPSSSQSASGRPWWQFWR